VVGRVDHAAVAEKGGGHGKIANVQLLIEEALPRLSVSRSQVALGNALSREVALRKRGASNGAHLQCWFSLCWST